MPAASMSVMLIARPISVREKENRIHVLMVIWRCLTTPLYFVRFGRQINYQLSPKDYKREWMHIYLSGVDVQVLDNPCTISKGPRPESQVIDIWISDQKNGTKKTARVN